MGRIAPLTQLMVGLSVALFYCICVIQNVEAHQGLAFINNQRSSSLSIDEIRSTAAITKALHVPRGGRIIDDDEDEDDEYDYEDDEEDDEEEEINITKSLKASTKKASSKAKKQKATSTKKIVNESLSKKKKSATTVKKTKRKLFHIPYILKAMLNPFTVFAMTRGYFASLFNIDYLQEDSSQTLRSALEEKAKKQSGSSSGKKPGRGRKMKPGQAKTLSDLPQLNA